MPYHTIHTTIQRIRSFERYSGNTYIQCVLFTRAVQDEGRSSFSHEHKHWLVYAIVFELFEDAQNLLVG